MGHRPEGTYGSYRYEAIEDRDPGPATSLGAAKFCRLEIFWEPWRVFVEPDAAWRPFQFRWVMALLANGIQPAGHNIYGISLRVCNGE